jgi:Bacterial Ig-like domain (group 3)/IPT/TIG domain
MIAFALVASVAGASRDAQAQTRAPSVTSIAPNSGPAAGGATVTITGTLFIEATAVKFGGTAAISFTVNSATSITATSPAGSGTVDVTVTTSGGTSATTSADRFAYVSAPSVTSITPTNGPAAGGTPVTITGTLFTGVTAVKFGGTAATSFTVNSATSITATSPAGSGTVDVTVTTSGGTSATTSADRFANGLVTTTAGLSSSKNPSSFGQPVILTAKVTGFSPTGAVTFIDGGIQIGTGTLAAGTAAFTTASLAVGSHSITAKYGGDSNNVASTSAALTQHVGAPTDSIKLREMQISVTPVVAHISGQAIVGAVDSAINAGFNDNPTALLPNGSGFTFHIAPDQPKANIVGNRTSAGGPFIFSGGGDSRADAGSLANGRQGGNGARPGTRLIDLPVLPLPPGSGMPPLAKRGFRLTK